MTPISPLRRFALVALLVCLVAVFSTDAVACLACKTSPDGWGFCRPNFRGGWEFCETVVRDRVNGTTGCEESGRVCYDGGTLVTDNDCWWTDLNGNCLI